MKETSYLRNLTNKAALIIQKYTVNDLDFLGDKSIKINYTHDEYYIVKSLLTLGEIESVFEQLVQSTHFLTNFRQTKSLQRNKITRFHHIVYHIESHLFRATGLLDRMLIHLNVVFKLGLDTQDCKPSNILKTKKGREGSYAYKIKDYNVDLYENLIQLLSLIDTLRVQRNLISHEKRYQSKQLKTIEMFHILQSNENSDLDTTPFKLFIKKENDKAVAIYKKQMVDFNTKMRTLLDVIFKQLESKWIEEHASIKLE